MRKIAFEEHVGMPEFGAVAQEESARLMFPNLSDPARQNNVLKPLLGAAPGVHRIPLMEKCGLDMQVLSVGGSVIQNDTDTQRAIANSRYANNKLYRITEEYPGKFRMMGTLPMQDPAAALDELERCIHGLKCVGFMLHGPTNFHYYDEPQFDGIWAALARYRLPLYLHPANPPADQIRMYDGFSELLGHTWNWNVYTATHALRIIFSGVFDRHPDATLMLGHMAEGLPYFLGRLDEGYQHRNTAALGRMSREPSYYIKKNLLMTTSGGWGPEAMHCAVDAIGAEHILFACDYPHFPLEDSLRLMEEAQLSPEQYELIYHGNAERMWGI